MPIFGPNISGLFSKPTQNRFFSRKLPRIVFTEPRPLRIKITDGIYFAKNLYRATNFSNRDWFYRSDDYLLEFYRYPITSSSDEIGLVLYGSSFGGAPLVECSRLVSSSQHLSSFPFPLFTDQWITSKADLYVENATPQILELSFSSPQNFVYNGLNASSLVSFTKTPASKPNGLPISVRRDGEANIGSVTVTLSSELADYILPNDDSPQNIAVNISKKPVTVAFTSKTFTYGPNSSYFSENDFSISDLVIGDTTANSFSNVLVGIPPIGSNAGSYVISFNPSYSSTKYIITNAPSNVTWQILKADQTISFSLATTAVTTSTIPLFATSTSNLPVSFSVQSGPGTITDGVLSFSDVGNVVIRATQSGNQNYNPAIAVDKTVEVSSSPIGSGLARNEAYDIYIQGTEAGDAYDGYYFSSSPASSSFWNNSFSNFTKLIGPPDGPNWSIYNADQSEQIDVYNDSVNGNFIPTTNWKNRDGSSAPQVFVTSPSRIITNSFPVRNPNDSYLSSDIPLRLVINGFNCSYGDFRTRNLRLTLQGKTGSAGFINPTESRFLQWVGYDSGHFFVLSEYADPLFGGGNYGNFSYQLGVFPNSSGSFLLLASRSGDGLTFENSYPLPWPKTFPTTNWVLGPAGSTGVLRFYYEQFPFPNIYIPSEHTAAPNAVSATPSIWLRSNTGVTTYLSDGPNRISEWSSSGTSLSTTFTALNNVSTNTISGPQLVNNVLNGYPVVRFDSNGNDQSFDTSGTGLNVDLPANRNLINYSMTYIFVWKNDSTMIQTNKNLLAFSNRFVSGSYLSRNVFQSFQLISNAQGFSYAGGWSSRTYLRGAYGGSGWGVSSRGFDGATIIYDWDQYSGGWKYDSSENPLDVSVVGGNNFKIYSYSYNPIERVQEIRINGIVRSQSPILPIRPKSQSLLSVSLGRTPDYGSSFHRVAQGGAVAQGDLAEFIFYDRAISGREVQKITNHLKDKYAII